MKNTTANTWELLAEEISKCSLLSITGGTTAGPEAALYPHDLVTPERASSGYIPDPPSLQTSAT